MTNETNEIMTREQLGEDLSNALSALFQSEVEVVVSSDEATIAFSTEADRDYMLEYFGQEKELFPAEGVDSWERGGKFYASHKLNSAQLMMLGEA